MNPAHRPVVMPQAPRPQDRLATADRVGMAASTVCAVHCALLPLLLGLAPALGLRVGGWVDFDQAFVVFASLLAATTLTLGYRRHRAFRAWALLVPGLALIWLGSFTSIHDHSLGHVAVMVAGGLLLAGAHLLNLRLSHAAKMLKSPPYAQPRGCSESQEQ